MRYRIPANLDIAELVKQYPPEIESFSILKLIAVINLIYYRTARNTWRIYDDHIQIHSNDFIKFVGADYKKYTVYLRDKCGVIQRDNTYKPQKDNDRDDPFSEPKSYAYKFTEKYEAALAVILSSDLMKELGAEDKKSRPTKFDSKKVNTLLSKYPFIKYLNDLEMDTSLAESKLIEAYKRIESSKTLTNEQRKKIADKVNSIILSIDEIASGNLLRYATEDSTGKRLHTPITRMKRELRFYLTYKGEQLVALDLKNSQPFLSLVLFDPVFWANIVNPTVNFSTNKGKRIAESKIWGKIFKDSEKQKHKIPQYLLIENIYPEFGYLNKQHLKTEAVTSSPLAAEGETEPVLPSTSPVNSETESVSPSISGNTISNTQLKSIEDRSCKVSKKGKEEEVKEGLLIIMAYIMQLGIDNQSLTEYQDDVVNGKLYERMIPILEKKMEETQWLKSYFIQEGFIWDEKTDPKRDIAKVLMMRVLYSRNKSQNTLTQLAKEIFKELYRDIYTVFNAIKKRKHNDLAIILQRIESFLILQASAQEINKQNKHIPLWTVHDSIVTIDKHKDLVKRIMEQTIKSFIGFAPKIDVQYWEEYKPDDINFIDLNDLMEDEAEDTI